MYGELVAIDLESTGLDPMQHHIIEVGMVRMRDGQVQDEFAAFVNPGVPIPDHITHITGIRAQDVANAQPISAVLPQIEAFVGKAPLIAHNASMEAGFLQQRHGILKNTQTIDTYELASILLPTAPRYNLNSLTTQLGIELPHAHRALDDARGAGLLYWALWQRMLNMPLNLLQEIVRLSSNLPWDALPIFRAAINHHPQGVSPTADAPAPMFKPMARPSRSLVTWDDDGQAIEKEVVRVSAREVEACFGDNSALARTMSGYQPRTQQITMAQAVREAFNEEQHLIVEAGTGTGKSLAYLLPAALFAAQNGVHVVVSTGTINLQDQLIHKDIPLLQEALALHESGHFSAVVLKGRSNYLCPRRLQTVQRRRPTTLDELRTLAKILVWLRESLNGDRSEISLRGPVENAVWTRLSAEDDGCQLSRCEGHMEGACPFYKARRQAGAAHLVIVNHALLISDAATEGNVLPPHGYVVIDEAHHLDEAITAGMTFVVDETVMFRRLADMGTLQKGMLCELYVRVKAVANDNDIMRLEQFIGVVDEASADMRAHLQQFFRAVANVVRELRKNRSSDYVTYFRVQDSHRQTEHFNAVLKAWQPLEAFMLGIAQAMEKLHKWLDKLEKYEIEDFEEFQQNTESAAEFFEKMAHRLKTFLLEPDTAMIYWISLPQGSSPRASIHMAPLHIGPLVEQYLWNAKKSVVLTSATLRTGDNIDFLRDRLYARDIPLLEVGSPFNYRESTLLYLPTNLPDPSDRRGYQRALEQAISELAISLGGRVLALFTSYTQLRQTAQAVGPNLSQRGITVYDQSDGTSRQILLEGFKTTDRAVLLGTRSFWEGVDVPGDSLSALIITRLPFAVPSDPVFSARSETYNNGFEEYAVPDAVLRFRQGFGRLIRSQTDRGVVVVMDSRITRKNYGAVFLESLPDCTVQHGILDGLSAAALQWLKRGPG